MIKKIPFRGLRDQFIELNYECSNFTSTKDYGLTTNCSLEFSNSFLFQTSHCGNMFKSKKQISVDLHISPEKGDYLVSEPISGKITLANSDEITIQAITVHVEGYISYFEYHKGSLLENRTCFFQSKPVVALIGKNNKILVIQSGNHPINFNCPPLNTHVSTQCKLPEKIKIFWEVVGTIVFEKTKTKVTSGHPIQFHVGNKMATLSAPNTVTIAKQKFLTHQPIQYKCILHKSVFIPGETVAMTLEIKNESRMKLLRMQCQLKQTWKTKNRTEENICLKFDVNGEPFFPLEPKAE